MSNKVGHSYSSPLLPKRLTSKVHSSLLCKNKENVNEVRGFHSPHLERAKNHLNNHSSYGLEKNLYEELNSDKSGSVYSGGRKCKSKISNFSSNHENTESIFDYGVCNFDILNKGNEFGLSEGSCDFSDLLKMTTTTTLDSDYRELSSLSPPASPSPYTTTTTSGFRNSSKYFSLIRRNRSQSPRVIAGDRAKPDQEYCASPSVSRKPLVAYQGSSALKFSESSLSSLNGYHHFDAINKESSWRKKYQNQQQQQQHQFPRSKKQFPDPNALFPIASTLSTKQSSNVNAGSRLNFDLEALLRIDDLRTWIKDLEASRSMGYQTLYSDYDDYDTEATTISTSSSLFQTPPTSLFGDITQKGYEKKKGRLLAPYVSKEQSQGGGRESSGAASPSTRSRRKAHRRVTRNESRYHSEVRQEAVKEALAQYQSRPKNLPLPSKRSSVMTARSPDRNRHDSDSDDSDDDSVTAEGSLGSSGSRSHGTPEVNRAPVLLPPPPQIQQGPLPPVPSHANVLSQMPSSAPLGSSSSASPGSGQHHTPSHPVPPKQQQPLPPIPPHNRISNGDEDERRRREISEMTDLMRNVTTYSQPPDVTNNTGGGNQRLSRDDRISRYTPSQPSIIRGQTPDIEKQNFKSQRT